MPNFGISILDRTYLSWYHLLFIVYSFWSRVFESSALPWLFLWVPPVDPSQTWWITLDQSRASPMIWASAHLSFFTPPRPWIGLGPSFVIWALAHVTLAYPPIRQRPWCLISQLHLLSLYNFAIGPELPMTCTIMYFYLNNCLIFQFCIQEEDYPFEQKILLKL